MTAAEILRVLVAIPTPSLSSNVPLLHWVREFVEARGWQVQLLPYTDERSVAKANMVARPKGIPPHDPIELAFVCHTDTVPFADSWSDALELHERDAFLHGCGACDVKGALASFLAAVGAAGDRTDDGVALILTADEEIGCKGMERLLASGLPHMRAAIVSEPTSLRIGVAGKGYGLARVTVTGAEAHSAFPSEGRSAIAIAARMIADLYATSQSGGGADALFDPSHTAVNVGLIEGGTAKNIIAGKCWFLVEWRPIPADPPSRVLGEIEQLALDMEGLHHGSRIVVERLRAEAGFAPVVGGRLRARLMQLVGPAVTGISFGSEASRIARVADEVIVMGPGDMHTAHSNRECVPVGELVKWTAILERLLRNA